VDDTNGTQIAQSFDAADRLTSRAIAQAAGAAGPEVESYAYDGLYRSTRAVSGTPLN